ncbi:MAG: lipoyl(octanoyl) transferase LipB [Solirubrobacteraceae bacterium]
MTVPDRSSAEFWVCHLGAVAYRDALAVQERIRARRQANELPDTLLLLEHPPVYTRGRRSGAEDLPLGEDFYRAKGIDVVAADRGGRLTYHGPGQLVGYPIMRIDDVHRYLRTMEDAIIAALAEAGVQARSRHEEGVDYTGVWVQDRKIASIGVHVSRGVTTHGFAVNVNNDLEPFSWVVACGLPDVTMTSLARELAAGGAQAPPGAAATFDCWPISDRSALACMRKRIAYSFCQAHGRRQRLVSPARLGIDTANAARRATERAPIKTISSPLAEPVPA